MRPNVEKDKSDLIPRDAFFADAAVSAAYAALMREVFDPAFEVGASSPWRPIALFDASGACAGGVETCVLRLMLDGAPTDATAIRLVAVAPNWRGLGLFRDLMTRAIAWCEAAASGPTLLYTENEDLYTRFGFAPVVQHAFAGPTPPRTAGRQPRIIDPSEAVDRALLDRLLAARAPVSNQCAVLGPPAIILDKLLAEHDFTMAYVDTLDALIVHELEDGAVVLVDIVAAAIPSMGDVLATLPARPDVVTLFAPDRLGWSGEPRREDAGLMIRGVRPSAMRRPFMLPPTAEF